MSDDGAKAPTTILRAYKSEIDPTAEQRRLLSRHISGARVAHNWVLERWHALAGITVLVRFLRACDGRDDAAGAAAYGFGLGLYGLTSGVAIKTKRPLRTKVDGKTAYSEKVRFQVAPPPGPPPDRYPDSDWIHAQLTAEKRSEESSVAWLTEVSSYVVREGATDVGLAYKAFMRRLKKHVRGDHSECKARRGGGCALGEPRFRNAAARSFHCDQGSAIRVTDRAIKVANLGWIRLKQRAYLPSTHEKSHKLVGGGKVCAAGISERGGRWYVALGVEVPQPHPIKRRGPGIATRERPLVRNGKTLGVDTGVRELAVTSDGVRFPGLEQHALICKLERRRKLWERRMARRWRPGKSRFEQSKRWREAKAEVAKYHRRISDVRDDVVAKAVRSIVDSGASKIVVRGPQVAQMLARGHGDPGTRNALGPRVHGARMGDVSRRLQYKMAWAYGAAVEAPKDFASTRRCSACGTERETDPRYPTWQCECGAEHDREVNSAINLRDFTGGDPGESPGRCGPGKPPPLAEGDNRRENRTARAETQVTATAPDGSETSALGSANRQRAGALHSVQPIRTLHNVSHERCSNAEPRAAQDRDVTAILQPPIEDRSQSGCQDAGIAGPTAGGLRGEL